MANRKRIQTRGRKYVQETEAEGSSVGVSAAPTAQLALNNKAHELQMCKNKMEWQNEKIEELTKERDFLKEQLVSGKSPNTMFSQSVALKKDGHKATAGSSSVSTLDSSSSEMSSKSTDSESSNSSSSEDKKRKKKGKGRKKASKMVKMEKNTAKRLEILISPLSTHLGARSLLLRCVVFSRLALPI
ncbi:unnamed protein product [Arctogadus glacialis]